MTVPLPKRVTDMYTYAYSENATWIRLPRTNALGNNYTLCVCMTQPPTAHWFVVHHFFPEIKLSGFPTKHMHTCVYTRIEFSAKAKYSSHLDKHCCLVSWKLCACPPFTMFDSLPLKGLRHTGVAVECTLLLFACGYEQINVCMCVRVCST